jgi:hypothetical protein
MRTRRRTKTFDANVLEHEAVARWYIAEMPAFAFEENVTNI